MFRYAQIDENGIVVCDSHLSGEVTADHMIPIGEGFNLTNKKYNKDLKKWEEYTPPTPEQKPDTNERLLAELQYQTALLEMEKGVI